MYIDTHAHFDICLKESSLTEDEMLSRLKKNNLKYAVQISTEPKIFEWSYNFAKKNDGIFFTIGIHPSEEASEKDLNYVRDFIQKVIDANDADLIFGIGEIGLDYYRMHQPKDRQIQAFEYQLDAANTFKLPVIIHSREAMDDTLTILRRKSPGSGIMHCFSGNSKRAKEVLDLGFYISFAGNLTYNKAEELHDAAKYVPLDRLLLETDAPFLTPVPLRGRKNMPEYVMHTYQFLAELRNENLIKIEDNIYNNFNNIK
ncbi:MAG: TatD family hydrolase [Spirochaetes bacterium]|nr:TatD family hydrolase [Spirochaetota bacterium]